MIETQNLKLIPCDINLLKSAIAGNKTLADHLNVIIKDNWTQFGVEALQYTLDRLRKNPEEESWWTYLPIHKKNNQLIGSGGYKGKPTVDGVVEIGYEITPEYRGLGLATEMAKGLIGNAQKDTRVKTIMAHTLGQKNPSTSVLKKCNFEKVEDLNDPEHGVIWKWKLKNKAV